MASGYFLQSLNGESLHRDWGQFSFLMQYAPLNLMD